MAIRLAATTHAGHVRLVCTGTCQLADTIADPERFGEIVPQNRGAQLRVFTESAAPGGQASQARGVVRD
jgi:hypothetical protein